MREHLFSRLILERKLLGEEDLRRYSAARDDVVRRGGRATLIQVLQAERRLQTNDATALLQEIETRGRSCFRCRRAFFALAGGPRTCPACGGPADLPPPGATPAATLAAPSPTLAQSFATSPGFAPQPVFTPSGRFPTNLAGTPPNGRGQVTGTYAPPPGGFAPPPMGSYGAPPPVYGAAAVAPTVFLAPGAALAQGPTTRADTTATGFNRSGPPASTDPGSRGEGAVRQGTELKSLGPYELTQELGRGGMGVVYKARHRQSGDVVALKVLLSGEFASPRMLQRFQEEAKTASRMEHPNIVPIKDVGEIDGIHYFTMQFIEGDLLSELIKGRGLSARRGAEIIRDIARAAHCAHENGVIHRDLKPSNVIVDRESGRPYLMDFGLAKDLESDQQLSKTGVPIGTPFYMPPEQAQGKHREIDARTDVYALGAVLYEILARKVPFNGTTQSELIRKIVEEDPVPPSKQRTGVPDDLETIALACLSKEKAGRFASAEALARDLDRALAGKPIEARRPPPWAKLVRFARRSPAVVAGIAGGVLLITILVVVVIHLQRAAEAQRLAQLEKEKKEKEEAEERARVAEKERKRQEGEKLRASGRADRLSARSAASPSAARQSLQRADDALGKALGLDEKPDAAALFERGLTRRDLGRYAEALEDFAKAAESDTHRARALCARGILVLRHAHDRDAARRDLAKAQPGDTKDATAKAEEEEARGLAQGYLRFLDGDTKEALALLRDMTIRGAGELGRDIDDAVSLLEASQADLVAAASGTGDGRAALQARDAAERAVAGDRMRVHFLLDRATARALTGDADGALADAELIQKLAPEWEEGPIAEAWGHARKRHPSEVTQALATARDRARGRPKAQDAIDELERRLKTLATAPKPEPPRPPRPPGAPRPPQKELFSDLQVTVPLATPEQQQKFEEAKRLAQSPATVDQAIAIVAELEGLDPAFADLVIVRANFLMGANRFDDARVVLTTALRKPSKNPVGYTLLGFIEQRAGKHEAAEVALKQAIALNPKGRSARVLLSQTYALLGKPKDAAETAGTLLLDDVTDIEAYRLLMAAGEKAKDYSITVPVAKKVFDASPKVLQARICYAECLVNARRGKEALPITEEGLKLYPNVWAIHYLHGIALAQSGRKPEARGFIEKALAGAPPEQKPAVQRFLDQLSK